MPRVPKEFPDLDGVYVDDTVGVAGTAWPIGTPQMPVSNLTDAIAIAIARNIYRIHIAGNFDLPIDLVGIQRLEFIGRGPQDLIRTNGKNTSFATFRNINLQASNGGNSGHLNAFDCLVGSVLTTDKFLDADLYHCSIPSTLNIDDSNLYDCYFQYGSVLYERGSNSLNISGAKGVLVLRNVDGGAVITVTGNGLRLEIESTCTVGDIEIWGNVVQIGEGGGVTVYNYTTNRFVTKKTTSPVATNNLFNVKNGAVRILTIVGYITTGIEAIDNNTNLQFTPSGGAAVDLCAVLNINGAAIRKIFSITGTKADAMVLSADAGVAIDPQAKPLVLPPGVIKLNCAASSTGVVDWYVNYEPMAPNAYMTKA